MSASSAAKNVVPNETPCAPNDNARAIEAPSPIPPDASTGTGATAATQSGSSSQIDVRPRTCPPACTPWAMIPSTPHAAAARASSTDPTWSNTLVPTRCAGSTNAAASPQNSTSTGTASSRHTSRCSTTGDDQPSYANPARITLTPNGRSVNARVRATWARTADADSAAEPTTPQPPAFDTAAANSAGAPSPNPTLRIGRSIPNNSHNAVRTTAP